MQCLWVFNKHDFSMKKNKKEVFSVEWALDTTAHFFSKVYESWTNFGHLHYLNNEAYWRDFNGFIELRIDHIITPLFKIFHSNRGND